MPAQFYCAVGTTHIRFAFAQMRGCLWVVPMAQFTGFVFFYKEVAPAGAFDSVNLKIQ